jgi:hypothetical protein
MATITTVVAATTFCGRAPAEPDERARDAQLLEQRLYPADLLDTALSGFQRRARTCSLAADCRAEGVACRWTGLNPSVDPFDI